MHATRVHLALIGLNALCLRHRWPAARDQSAYDAANMLEAIGFDPVTGIPTLAAAVHKLLIASDNYRLEPLGDPASDGVSYIHLFREKTLQDTQQNIDCSKLQYSRYLLIQEEIS